MAFKGDLAQIQAPAVYQWLMSAHLVQKFRKGQKVCSSVCLSEVAIGMRGCHSLVRCLTARTFQQPSYSEGKSLRHVHLAGSAPRIVDRLTELPMLAFIRKAVVSGEVFEETELCSSVLSGREVITGWNSHSLTESNGQSRVLGH